MTLLEQIELRLYRYAQNGYKSEDHVKQARLMAAEIIGLVNGNETPATTEREIWKIRIRLRA